MVNPRMARRMAQQWISDRSGRTEPRLQQQVFEQELAMEYCDISTVVWPGACEPTALQILK
jgi:hypothetical protein